MWPSVVEYTYLSTCSYIYIYIYIYIYTLCITFFFQVGQQLSSFSVHDGREPNVFF
jgi:hypothetical protein